MFETLRWLVAAEVIGLAAFPIAHAIFPALRDRGWGFAKPLGLILFSFVVWILSYVRILPNSAGSYWLVVAVAGALGLVYMYRRRRDLAGLIRREWPALLAGELLFLGFFAAWVAYRAYDPSIAGTEKPMDFLFLNASANAAHAPPTDPWLSGQPVAYYYFGYWMMAGLSQMAAVPTFVAFNLSLALLAGLSAGAIFTLVYGLVRADGGRRVAGMLAGVAATVLLLVAANLIGLWEVASLYDVGSDGFFEWMAVDGLEKGQPGEVWRPDSHWWWWRASRVINTFDASGVGLDFTIQEFPFFSFLLGDLHPHVMSIPFVILGLGMVLNLFLSPVRWSLGWIRRNPAQALVLALIVGGVGFINAWDIAILSGLLLVVAALKVYRSGSSFTCVALGFVVAPAMVAGSALAIFALLTVPRFEEANRVWVLLASVPAAVVVLSVVGMMGVYRASPRHPFWGILSAVIAMAAVVGIGLTAYSPFYFGTFSSQVPPEAPIGAAEYATRPIHFLTVWGLPLVLIAPFLVAMLAVPVRRHFGWLRALATQEPTAPPERSRSWTPSYSPMILAGLLIVVPYFLWAFIHLEFNEAAQPRDMARRLVSVSPLAIVSFGAIVALAYRARRGAADGGLFALVLITLSLYMLFGVELIFVRDFFDNRMNTVFKAYYQVWIFLAAAGAYGLHYWRSHHVGWMPPARAVSKTAAGLAAVVMVSALYYPVAAVFSKTGGFSGDPTLDGLAYVTRTSPAERAAIAWLAENAGPDDTVLEAVGGSYTEFGRISASTGVPTVLGWPGHEHQWRGSFEAFEGREADVETIYRTPDSHEASRLLEKYGVTYVFAGPRERSRYGLAPPGKFDEIGDRVFENNGTLIFRIRE